MKKEAPMSMDQKLAIVSLIGVYAFFAILAAAMNLSTTPIGG